MRTVTKAVVPACIALLMVWASPLHAKNDKNAKPNGSGTYKLNLKKSDFGKMPKPKEVILKIADTPDETLKYSVTGTDDKGQPINVEYDGAVDGKPHKETGPQGGNTVTYKDIDDYTSTGTSTSADGKTTETSTFVSSKDFKVLTITTTGKGPEGEYKLRLVYDKQ
jgi:hypothetical protein